MSELLSVAEAAQVLDIPERTFRRWVAAGRIPSEQVPLMMRGRALKAEVVTQFRDALKGAGQRPASDPPAPANVRPVTEDDQPVPAIGRPHAGHSEALQVRAEAAERERERLSEDVQ